MCFCAREDSVLKIKIINGKFVIINNREYEAINFDCENRGQLQLDTDLEQPMRGFADVELCS